MCLQLIMTGYVGLHLLAIGEGGICLGDIPYYIVAKMECLLCRPNTNIGQYNVPCDVL